MCNSTLTSGKEIQKIGFSMNRWLTLSTPTFGSQLPLSQFTSTALCGIPYIHVTGRAGGELELDFDMWSKPEVHSHCIMVSIRETLKNPHERKLFQLEKL